MSNDKNTADFLKLKQRVDTLRARRDKAEGALDSEMCRLKGLGFNSVEEAKAFVLKSNEQATELQDKVDRLLEELDGEISTIEGSLRA
jgi:hypothetical protein